MTDTLKVFPVFLFLLLALAVVMLLVGPAQMADVAISFAESHAVPKHKDSALQVRGCLERGGALQTWVNPSTGRRARICQVGPETWGVQIIQEGADGVWKEITSFIKSKMTRIEQVTQYLKNSGYTPLQ